MCQLLRNPIWLLYSKYHINLETRFKENASRRKCVRNLYPFYLGDEGNMRDPVGDHGAEKGNIAGRTVVMVRIIGDDRIKVVNTSIYTVVYCKLLY